LKFQPITDMSDFKNRNSLAVIGMDVTLPGCNGLAGYGHSIYRGLSMVEKTDYETPSITAFHRTVLGALRDGALSGDQVSVIALSPILDELIPDCLKDSKIFQMPTIRNPLITALLFAERWLEAGNGDAVLMLEYQPDMQTKSAVILTLRDYALNHQKRIYASISGVSEIPAPISGSFVEIQHRTSMEDLALQPEMVGLIITSSITKTGIASLGEQSLLFAYDDIGKHMCALSGGASGLLGLIKASWCVYWRVIPGMPDWEGLSQPVKWDQSAFYVPLESRTWFCSSRQKTRIASYYMTTMDGSVAYLFLTEETSNSPRPDFARKQENFYLFPITAESIEQLVLKIGSLENRVHSISSISGEARDCYARFEQDRSAANISICLLSHTSEELLREIGFAMKGLINAQKNRADWQTPMGSYFTPLPLGETGDIAFVYPGAFNSYPGVGQDLFYLFPFLYDRISMLSNHVDELLYERMLYPRSISPLTRADFGEFEEQLIADPMAMLISGTSLAVLYTILLRDVFELKAVSAFGYSLGEISMLFANHIWTNADNISAAFLASNLFRTRLAGPQNAVRSYWGTPLSNNEDNQEIIWENHLLITSPDIVRDAIAYEPRVYLTHINTPRQVVIGGDPAGCQRVIDSLKIHSIKAPYNYAIHNAAIIGEYDSMVNLFNWPSKQQSEITLYSAATNQTMPIDRNSIARQIATSLCTCLNFPQLVQQVYQGGARIFIEMGAGSNCARWVHDSLDGQPHAAFSINHKGVDDYSALLRLLARILCHRIPVNISSLYR
jgi:PfaB family protein